MDGRLQSQAVLARHELPLQEGMGAIVNHASFRHFVTEVGGNMEQAQTEEE